MGTTTIVAIAVLAFGFGVIMRPGFDALITAVASLGERFSGWREQRMKRQLAKLTTQLGVQPYAVVAGDHDAEDPANLARGRPVYQADHRVSIDGEMLKMAIECAGVRQSDLAYKFGMSSSWLWAVLYKHQTMYLHDVRLMSNILDCEQSDLLVNDNPTTMDMLPLAPVNHIWIDGAQLRIARHRSGMDQARVAKDANLSHETFRKYENQAAAAPLTEVIAIAQALGAPIKSLVVPGQQIAEE